MHVTRVCLIGFGGVAREMCRILASERDRYPGLAGLNILVSAIVTGSHGALVSSNGLDLKSALLAYESEGRFTSQCRDFREVDGLDAARLLDYDILVELSTLNISSRGEPAFSFCKAALERGLSVVTANKGPLAFHFQELVNLACETGGKVAYESTVMDGAPVFRMARSCLRGARIQAVEGILNSTTNFILTELESGCGLDEALERARRKGFVEADPSLDLDGWDAAAKICVLANSFLGANLSPLEVEREGILQVDADRISFSRKRGCRLKQVAQAEGLGSECRARVQLRDVSEEDVLARVKGEGGAVRFHTDLMGPIVILQERPGLSDTAFGVLNDLLFMVNSDIP